MNRISYIFLIYIICRVGAGRNNSGVRDVVYFQESSLNYHNLCQRLDGRTGVCVPFEDCPEEDKQNTLLLCSSVQTNLICCPKVLPHEKNSEGHKLDQTGNYSFVEKCKKLNQEIVLNYDSAYDQNVEYPSIAVIGYYNGVMVSWLCVGAIITDQFIISPASCDIKSDPLVGRSANVVRVTDRVLKNSNTFSPGELLDIEAIIKPEEYAYDKLNYNMQLIKLKKKLEFQRYLRPACLWPEIPKPSRTIQLISPTWKIHSNNESEFLKTDYYGAISETNCMNSYNVTLNSNLFCAKIENTTVDGFCSQTYDAPVFVKINGLKNNYGDLLPLYYLAGVKAYGERCDSAPYIFIRAAYYRNWIEKHLNLY